MTMEGKLQMQAGAVIELYILTESNVLNYIQHILRSCRDFKKKKFLKEKLLYRYMIITLCPYGIFFCLLWPFFVGRGYVVCMSVSSVTEKVLHRFRSDLSCDLVFVQIWIQIYIKIQNPKHGFNSETTNRFQAAGELLTLLCALPFLSFKYFHC